MIEDLIPMYHITYSDHAYRSSMYEEAVRGQSDHGFPGVYDTLDYS